MGSQSSFTGNDNPYGNFLKLLHEVVVDEDGYILCETDLVVSLTSLFYQKFFNRMLVRVILPYIIYFVSVCFYMSLYLIERANEEKDDLGVRHFSSEVGVMSEFRL